MKNTFFISDGAISNRYEVAACRGHVSVLSQYVYRACNARTGHEYRTLQIRTI